MGSKDQTLQLTLLQSMMKYWLNIAYLIRLPRLGWHVSIIERMKKMELKIKIYLIIYITIISIIIICNNQKQLHLMIKPWLMISHMSFMTNEWNVPHHWHIIVPHHILNDHCFQQFVYNDFRAICHFCPIWLEY